MILLLLPVLSCFSLFLFNHILSKKIISLIAVLSSLVMLGMACFFSATLPSGSTLHFWEWFSIGQCTVPFAFYIDALSKIMMVLVTGIGSLVVVFSVGYMSTDPRYGRYMAYVLLFILFMLILVLANNYVLLFVGWEGVGLCSYLLIGFWFHQKENTQAAKKAFLMNKIGDVGLLLALSSIGYVLGTFLIQDALFKSVGLNQVWITVITLGFVIAAVGKSAQIPLYTWLPDAMTGPTPASALIHAATMVTAGIYLIVRSSTFFLAAIGVNHLLLIIGLLTAIFAACIATCQQDIKKILAFSTVSQLGLMVVALGLGAYKTAIFHLVTHAFFKALLFLGAGSVIHGLQGQQDIRKMGGLYKKMPVTCVCMAIGCLALAGLPPLSGFISKEMILLKGWENSPFVLMALIGVSILTALYAMRLLGRVFGGIYKGSQTPHESGLFMTVPLIILAMASCFGGFIPIPTYLGAIPENSHGPIGLAVFSAFMVFLFLVLFWRQYVIKPFFFSQFLENQGYLDKLYQRCVVKPLLILSTMGYRFVEVGALELPSSVLRTGWRAWAKILPIVSNGRIQTAIHLFFAGVILLFLIHLFFADIVVFVNSDLLDVMRTRF